MDSLFDLLSNRIPDEPSEIRVIKDFVRRHFNENVNVAARDKDIIVTVRSAALAGALRARTTAIKQALTANQGRADKRLVFRIGQVE
jgi:hypothetical protein